jgi:hypothetical protein
LYSRGALAAIIAPIATPIIIPLKKMRMLIITL